MKKRGRLAIIGVALALTLALAAVWAAAAREEWPPIKVDLSIQRDGSIVTATVMVENEGAFDTGILNVRAQVPKGAMYVDSWAGGGRGFNAGVFDGNDVGWVNGGVKAGGRQGPFTYMFDISTLSAGAEPSIIAWVKWEGKVAGTAVSKALSARTGPPTQMGPAPSAPEAMPMTPAGPAAPVVPAIGPSPEMLAEGKAMYTKSCAACHGPNGEGTSFAPKVAGHGVSGTKVQARNPIGSMPAFTQAQLSDADLDKVAGFLLSLGPATGAALEWEKAAPETIHHWMAMVAIKGNDVPEARLHLEEALAFVKEPRKKSEMEKALDFLAKGDLHAAEDEIEEMAGSDSPSGIAIQRFHLALVQQAIDGGDATQARRHLERFALKATEKQKALVEEALEKIAANDLHGAEHEVEELLES